MFFRWNYCFLNGFLCFSVGNIVFLLDYLFSLWIHWFFYGLFEYFIDYWLFAGLFVFSLIIFVLLDCWLFHILLVCCWISGSFQGLLVFCWIICCSIDLFVFLHGLLVFFLIWIIVFFLDYWFFPWSIFFHGLFVFSLTTGFLLHYCLFHGLVVRCWVIVFFSMDYLCFCLVPMFLF